jgi:2-keto-4-pentenoate hydratase
MTNSPAQLLWNARVNKTQITHDFDGYPTSEIEAYNVQTEMIVASGLDVVGWKIGATVEALFPVLAVTQPFLGPLFKPYTYESGTEIEAIPSTRVETEIAVRLKSDLPARETPYNRAEIEAAVQSIHPSFEIIEVRFDGELTGAGFRAIADGGLNGGVVLGPEIINWNDYNLANYPVSLAINGNVVCEGNFEVLLWDHVFDALSWSLAQPILSQRGFQTNDIIMTGTSTGMISVSPGDYVVADFGKMGDVHVHFV